jgi:hypothetical protein
MTAEDQIENSMLSIAKKSVLKTLCLLLSFDMQFPKLDAPVQPSHVLQGRRYSQRSLRVGNKY